MSTMEHEYRMIMISKEGDLKEDGESVQIKRQGVDKRWDNEESAQRTRKTGWRDGFEQDQRDQIHNLASHFLSCEWSAGSSYMRTDFEIVGPFSLTS